MREHVVSIQKMIAEYSASVVVAGCSLEYKGPCLFHDGEVINIRTHSSVLKKGILIQGNSDFFLDSHPLASFKIYFRPVNIGDHTSSAATSGHLNPDIQSLFTPEERSDLMPQRFVKQNMSKIESEGMLIATHQEPFRLNRYAMDFADQWAFIESAAFCSVSREALAISGGEHFDKLVTGISKPLQSYHLDLKKPYFLLDEGLVDTKVYILRDDIFYVHRLMGTNNELHAVAIEQFNYK
ncbi:MAG TPA: hypothetical protein PKC70_01195 [Cellvibrionaceae bacterium]|nr:hypothetical protein [Cellvibrionaceae bacterium]HNG58545.1 hypothetical protein [Cellvibrionaceae bacterium]